MAPLIVRMKTLLNRIAAYDESLCEETMYAMIEVIGLLNEQNLEDLNSGKAEEASKDG
jgi:hypothetical protein